MNKTASCIKIIQVLSSTDIINTNDLAEILETNPRNIREYIKELEACGYQIEAVKGSRGGYRLLRGEVLPSVSLSDEEKNSLIKLLPFLRTIKYEDYDNIENSLGRFLASGDNKEKITPLSINERFPLQMDKLELQQRFAVINEAIDSQLKCEVSYLSTTNKISSYIIHPYKLFLFNGSWFVLAWNEKVQSFNYLKLNRIEAISKTRSRFTIMKSYNESDYLDEYGMKKNGEFYSIVLKFTGLNVAIKERIYGKNQEIKELDSNHLLLSCEMQNKEVIKSFVLSFGSKVEVLEPEWLKEELKTDLWKVIEYYE